MLVDPNNDYILPPPMVEQNKKGGEDSYYSIAVFHQLHCLVSPPTKHPPEFGGTV
jgi:hypothetical protein